MKRLPGFRFDAKALEGDRPLPNNVLAILCQVQADVRGLTRRVEELDRELARMKRGGAPVERRHLSLEEADRRGVLPRSARTVRTWMATPESRTASKVDLFARRIAGRVEVDLEGIEKWRLAMTAPTVPNWPKHFGPRKGNP
jgi:hypothetical protein